MGDQEPPPPYFGDYPHGAHWSAVRRDGAPLSDEADSYTVDGSELHVMWDEGAGPLWAEDGLLPDDPEWLRRALALSDALVTDLLTWLSDMTERQRERAGDWKERVERLDERGRKLAERLQDEVGTRYTVSYRA